MRTLFVPQKENRFHAVAIRQGALALYVVFLLVFNIVLTPMLGLGKRAFASSISASRLVDLANAARADAGVGLVSVDSRLVAAATAKANDMFEDQYWAHYAPDGKSPWDFILEAGYNYVYAGENLAIDFITSDAVHNAWMNSPSHRDNIINPNYKNIGIAVVDGVFEGSQTTIVVQMFGSETSAPAPEPETPPAPKPKPPVKNAVIEAPSKPQISEPRDGDILNTGAFAVRGTSDPETLVHVYDNDTKRAEVTANEGVFSVELANLGEGGHDLSAEAENDAGVLSERSTPVSVTIDMTLPEIDDSTYSIRLEEGSILAVEFNASPDTVSATAVIESYSLPLTKGGTEEAAYFSGKLTPSGDPKTWSGKTLTLTLVDTAGNTAVVDKTIPAYDVLTGYGSTLGGRGSIFSDMFAYVASLSTQQRVNIGVALFLIVLFAIDGAILWKMGIFRESANGSAHVAILSLAIVIGIFGGIGTIA